MKCEVEGSPRPQVTWYLQSSKLPDLQKFPDYIVNANEELIVPDLSLVKNSFLCNCSNPLDTVARFARGKIFRIYEEQSTGSGKLKLILKFI